MVGSAIVRRLRQIGCELLLTPTSAELDLMDQAATAAYFEREDPEIVVVAAARVGGILANSNFPADFIYDNLMIEANVIHQAKVFGSEKLLFLGSSCIYPRMARQPMSERELLTGPLEPTNEPYAIAKIAGIKLCESYFRQFGSNFYSAMPTNLYGPNDNFDLDTSHVIPALIRKFHEGRINGSPSVSVWGTGTPRREFLYVDDLAEAVVYLLENVDAHSLYEREISHVNIGTGEDVTIRELAETVSEVTGFDGEIAFDAAKPDGTPRKLLDTALLTGLGWRYSTPLRAGLDKAYQWFLDRERSDTPNIQ